MDAESRNRLGYWGSATLSMRSNVSLGRKRDYHCAKPCDNGGRSSRRTTGMASISLADVPGAEDGLSGI